MILLILIGVVGIYYVSSLGGGGGDSDFSQEIDNIFDQGPGSRSLHVAFRIKYEAGGTTKSASLTYQNAQGNTEQKDKARVPWSETFTVDRGEFLYISAQNNREHGTIWCKIHVVGEVVEEAESSGGYVIASCSGSAGNRPAGVDIFADMCKSDTVVDHEN